MAGRFAGEVVEADWRGPLLGPARHFVPEIETPSRACRALRRVPILRCLFVKGGPAPLSHSPPRWRTGLDVSRRGRGGGLERPPPGPARHFVPEIETPSRACRALRRVPILRCLFVKGGPAPLSHSPPRWRTGLDVSRRGRGGKTARPPPGPARHFVPEIETPSRACRALRRVPILRCLFVKGGPAPLSHSPPRWRTGLDVSRRGRGGKTARPPPGPAPALRAGNRNSLARLWRASASSDFALSFCERGASPPFTLSPRPALRAG